MAYKNGKRTVHTGSGPMNESTGKREQVFVLWDSMGEAIEDIEQGKRERGSAFRTGRGDWTMTNSFAEAKGLALDGWTEPRKMMVATLDKVNEAIGSKPTMIPTYRFDVAGMEPSVDLFLANEPENMRDVVLSESARFGRIVKIAIQTSTSAGIDAQEILKRGIAVLALVEALRLAGIGAEIWAINSIGGWDGGVKVLGSSDPIDIDSIAFAIAHPSMQRRIYFGLQEQDPDERFPGGGYGGVGRYNGQASKAFLDHMGFDVHVTSANAWGDGYVGHMASDPVKWVRETVTGLGVTWEQ